MEMRRKLVAWFAIPVGAVVAAPSVLAAVQDAGHHGAGTVRDADGSHRLPTLDEAIRALTMKQGEPIFGKGQNPDDLLVAMLRQTFERRSRAELDAIADAAVELALSVDDYDGMMRVSLASWALIHSQRPTRKGDGIPYAGALEALVRIYETRVERLVDNAADPFKEMAVKRLDGTLTGDDILPSYALSRLYGATGGRAYVRELFERSEPPPVCPEVWLASEGPPPGCPTPPGSTWCETGVLLFNRDWNLRENGPNPAAPEGFYERCSRSGSPGRTIFFPRGAR